jgi:hypothetical protein
VTVLAVASWDPLCVAMGGAHGDVVLHRFDLWGGLAAAALATTRSKAWRRLWHADGDHAIWLRVQLWAGPLG